MPEAPDYTKYTLEELEDVFQHIDRELFPDRFNSAILEIETRRRAMPGGQGRQKVRARRVSLLFRYQPPDYGEGGNETIRWSLRDVVFGLLFMTCLYGGYRVLSYSTFLRYRPWIAEPFGAAAWIAVFALMILYALWLCRGRPYWHVVRVKGVRPFLKECLIAFGYIVVVMLLLIPVKLLLEAGFGLSTGSTRFAWTDSAPSSLLNMAILVSMFTIGPVAEELFFRGFLYSALRSRLNVFFSASIQAAVFSLIHRENLFGSIAIFALGVAMALLYERRRNLLSPILLHVIKNAMPAVPLLVLSCMNYHIPSHTWEEASQPPPWLSRIDKVEAQGDGMKQWQYAIDRWGSKGSKQWKKEAAGFVAVCDWYPEQKPACAKAKLGLATVYLYYLKDPRRAIVEVDELLKCFPGEREQCGQALAIEGWAYYGLRDFSRARGAFLRLGKEFAEQQESVETAREGIKRLDVLEHAAGAKTP